MKLLKKCLTVGGVCATVFVTAAATRPPEVALGASVSLTCRSFRLGSAAESTPDGLLASSRIVVFSTPGPGARFFGNGEFRPSLTRPGYYEAGYAIGDLVEGSFVRAESGSLFVPIPDGDANGDTLPDTADWTASVDMTLQGDVVPSGNGSRVSKPIVTLHLMRAAGDDAGNFSVDLIDGETLTRGLIKESPLVGAYSVLHVEGDLAYQRTDAGALLNFDLSNTLTNATAVSRLTDPDNVRISAFRMRVVGNRKTSVIESRAVRVAPSVLTRSGNVYSGAASLSDGLTETTPPDFRNWFMQIADLNDSDKNMIPDFSDTLLPYVAVQPSRQIVAFGGTVTLSVVVVGTGPFTYEWQQNGHGLSSPADATQRVLTIPSADLDDKGSYRVRISNAAGSVWSDSTSVSFTTPAPAVR